MLDDDAEPSVACLLSRTPVALAAHHQVAVLVHRVGIVVESLVSLVAHTGWPSCQRAPGVGVSLDEMKDHTQEAAAGIEHGLVPQGAVLKAPCAGKEVPYRSARVGFRPGASEPHTVGRLSR